MNWKNASIVSVIIMALFACIIGMYFFQSNKLNQNQTVISDVEESAQASSPDLSQTPSAPTKKTPIGQKADLKQIINQINELFSKNANNYYVGVKIFSTGEQFINDSKPTPSASVIKIFIMLHAYQLIQKGDLDENKLVENQSVKDLLKSMITRSDNNATNKLIDYFGMVHINETIKKEGYKDTVLNRRMLDYEAQKKGLENYTSIEDVMLFLDRLYKYKEKEPNRDMLSLLLQQQVRTKIPSKLPKNTKVANKTGELQNIENDIGIVFTNHGDYAIAVLTNNVSNVESTRGAIGTFTKNIYDYLNQ